MHSMHKTIIVGTILCLLSIPFGGMVTGMVVVIVAIAGIISNGHDGKRKSTKTRATKTKAAVHANKVEKPMPENGNLGENDEEPEPIAQKSLSGNQSWGWVPMHEFRTVHGLDLPGGFYFGKGLPNMAKTGIDPALVVPDLPIDESSKPEPTSFWPSWESLSPEQRHAWMRWACTGYSDPKADIGFVFIRFYAIERHTIVDNPDEIEIEDMRQEIVRLLGIYGKNKSFHRYATSLLDAMETMQMKPDDIDDARISISKRVHFGQPLTYKDVLLVAKTEKIPMPAASRKHPDLFETALASTFKRKFPDGMKISIPSEHVNEYVEYKPASSGFGKNSVFPIPTGFPVVARAREMTETVSKLLNTAAKIIEPYAKAYSKEVGEPHLSFYLPVRLWNEEWKRRIATFRKTVIDGEIHDIDELCLSLFLVSETTTTKWQTAVDRLKEIGIGCFPETLPEKNESSTRLCTLFHDDGKPLSFPLDFAEAAISVFRKMPSNVFAESIAELRKEMNIDGKRSESAFRLMSEDERQIDARKMGKFIKTLNEQQKVSFCNVCAKLSCRHGAPGHESVSVLEELFKKMDRPASELYSMLHEGADNSRGGLQSLRTETAKVDELLWSIFNNEESDPQGGDKQENDTNEKKPIISPNRIRTLDENHSMFLLEFPGKTTVSWEEFSSLAEKHGLFAAGAVETINDACWEETGQPIFDGDDPIEIDDEALSEFIGNNR